MDDRHKGGHDKNTEMVGHTPLRMTFRNHGSSMVSLLPGPPLGVRAFVTFGEHSSPQIQFLEKIIPLVINHDEGGEVFDVDFPDRFHAEFGIL